MSVGQYQLGPVSTPTEGGPLDGDVVQGHFDAIVAAHNGHDANDTMHVLWGTMAARPAAITQGRIYITTAGGGRQVFFATMAPSSAARPSRARSRLSRRRC